MRGSKKGQRPEILNSNSILIAQSTRSGFQPCDIQSATHLEGNQEPEHTLSLSRDLPKGEHVLSEFDIAPSVKELQFDNDDVVDAAMRVLVGANCR